MRTIWDSIRQDCEAIEALERQTGQAQAPHDGKDELIEAYQGALQLAHALKKLILER